MNPASDLVHKWRWARRDKRKPWDQFWQRVDSISDTDFLYWRLRTPAPTEVAKDWRQRYLELCTWWITLSNRWRFAAQRRRQA